MMRTSALFLLFCCVLPSAAHAEDRQLTTDGTWWKGLPILKKVGFIEGYATGYSAGAGDLRRAIKVTQTVSMSAAAAQSADEDSPAGFTFGSLLRGVDSCYSDFRNTALDVRFCLDWTVRGMKGESDKSREDYLTRIREHYLESLKPNSAHDF